MTVLSLRISEKELRHIRSLAKKEHIDQSQIARHLIGEGWKLYLLTKYKEGILSLGSLAKGLGLPLSLTLDFLEKLGISSPLSYEDYLQGLEVLK